MATLKPTGVSKRVTGAAKVEPGGPDIYVAVMGNESHCSGLERRSFVQDEVFQRICLPYVNAAFSLLWAGL